jgi:hypothetical protein
MKTFYLFSLIFLTTMLGCKDDDDNDDTTSDNPTADAIIYANFSNDGTNQVLSLDQSQTSGPIDIENQVTFLADGSRFKFTFSGVTFTEGNAIYEVEEIISQRNLEGDWQQDSENFLDPSLTKSLDIVLVLDVSSSLGQSLSAVKNSAIVVLNQIFTNNANTKVAVVKFSRGHVASQLSSNFSQLSQFVNQTTMYTDTILGGGTYPLENKNETALYEAMLEGISILQSSNARGQGLITFTDGANNFQFDPVNENRSVVISALNNSQIRSYTVGFIGNANEINETALDELAVNGSFSSPSSIDELDDVFTLFSNSIGAVYDLTYDTNNAPFTGTKAYRFLIDLNRIN